jgi:hypothetical protein
MGRVRVAGGSASFTGFVQRDGAVLAEYSASFERDGGVYVTTIYVSFGPDASPWAAQVVERDWLAEWYSGSNDDFRRLTNGIADDATSELLRARAAQVVAKFDANHGSHEAES